MQFFWRINKIYELTPKENNVLVNLNTIITLMNAIFAFRDG